MGSASTLIVGPSGSGKTLMGLHFIFHGAHQGEPGVIASLQENTTQLQRIAAGFGWSLDEPHVEVMYRSPVDIYIDEWASDLMQAVERTGARRVLVDSLADLRMARLTRRGSASSSTRSFSVFKASGERHDDFRSPRSLRSPRLSDSAVSHLSDNIVLLSYVKEQDSIHRAMAVVKSRASHHEPGIRQFLIGHDGIVLADGRPGRSVPDIDPPNPASRPATHRDP
jgi:circadian clock protein KaiC